MFSAVSAMDILDGDDVRLSHQGRYAERDIVQVTAAQTYRCRETSLIKTKDILILHFGPFYILNFGIFFTNFAVKLQNLYVLTFSNNSDPHQRAAVGGPLI